MPSACGAFTSTCCLRSARTVARSRFSTASASRAPLAMLVTGWTMPKATARAADQTWNFMVRGSNGQRLKQLVHLARAVRELIEVDAHFVQQRQVQIRQRGRLAVFDVTPAFHSRCGPASDQDRQVRVVMHVGIADAAAVKIQTMTEQ